MKLLKMLESYKNRLNLLSIATGIIEEKHQCDDEIISYMELVAQFVDEANFVIGKTLQNNKRVLDLYNGYRALTEHNHEH